MPPNAERWPTRYRSRLDAISTPYAPARRVGERSERLSQQKLASGVFCDIDEASRRFFYYDLLEVFENRVPCLVSLRA
jgi:hypothetical protein